MNCGVGLFLLCITSESLQHWPKTPEDPPHVRITRNPNLGFTGDQALSTVKSHNRTIMCVFDSWAIDRKGQGKFGIADVNATLCTHLILRYAEIKYDYPARNYLVQVTHDGLSDEVYKQAVGLKDKNPELKVMLSIGGRTWDFQAISTNYDTMLWNFTRMVVEFLKKKKLNGLNVEWMWPAVNDKGEESEDWFRVTNLIASLSKAMEGQHLQLGLTLPSDTSTIESSYDIPVLDRYLDYLILIGQDLAGHREQIAGHHSPLLPLTGRTVGKTIEFVLSKNVSANKVILGIPLVGRTFELIDQQKVGSSGLGAATKRETVLQEQFKKDEKVLNYNEICSNLKHVFTGWTAYEDEAAKVPFMKDGGRSWVAFDNTKSVQAKVEFGEEHRLGGYAAWSITNDDFKGSSCGRGINYPLLRTINYVLSKRANPNEVNPTVPTVTDSLNTTTIPPTSTSPKSTSTKVSSETITSQTIMPTSSILPQPTSTTKSTGPNASHDSSETQTTSPQPRKENQGGTEMSGTGGDSSVVIYVVVVTLLGMILLLTVAFFLVRRKRSGNTNELSHSEIRRFKNGYTYEDVKFKRKTQAIVLEMLEAENNINCSPYDNSLEVPHTEYEIYTDEILGSGAYIVVLRGKVRNDIVAVKTVKPLSSKDHLLSLMEEIKVMTYLGKHDNILGLIGANTALLHRGFVYVFVELYPLGSLEKYLRANKSSFVDLMKNDEFTSEKFEVKEDGKEISSATLLIWAHQISIAMQFLASKKVIHGDLRTRNVCVCSKYLVKISDFGSSRKMYAYCNYIKNNQVIEAVNHSEEPLPWRHISLETLTNLEFSTKSDVWTFGVTLWEIFSLGALPYPGMSYTFGFTDDLVGGRRMFKPKYATTELYEKTMLQTWNENPQDRPSFEELCSLLHGTVERVSFQHVKFTPSSS